MLLMLHMQCTFPCKTEMRWLTKMVNSKCLAKSSVLTKWHVIQIDIIFTLSLLSLSLHLLLCFRLSYSHWHISSGQQNLLVHFLTSQQASTIVISRNDYTVTNFILLHNALTTSCYNGANMMMAIEKYGSHWKANRIITGVAVQRANCASICSWWSERKFKSVSKILDGLKSRFIKIRCKTV